MSHVTIELGRDDRNMDVHVDPLKMSIAGKFSKGNISVGTVSHEDASATCPEIPGWRIKIDYKNKGVKLFHPWHNTQAGERAAKAFRKAYGRGFDVSVPVSVPENGDMRDLDDDALQEWLKWAYRITNDKPNDCLASIVDGEFPKGTKEALEKDRQLELRIRTTRERIARQLAMEELEAEARKAAGAPAK